MESDIFNEVQNISMCSVLRGETDSVYNYMEESQSGEK